MNFLSLRSTLIQMLRISRPYTTPYAALCCVSGLFSGSTVPTHVQIAVALFLAPTLSFSMPALNDYAHRHADVLSTRGRNYHPRLLLIMGLTGFLIGVIIATIGGVGVIFGLVASLIVGLIYAKSKKLPGLANLVRGMYTVVLVLACASMTGWQNQTFLIALMIYFADCGGNIWGDVRDRDTDSLAGTRTLAVVNRPLAIHLAWILLTLSLFPLGMLLADNIVLMMSVISGMIIIGFILLVLHCDDPYRHRWILHLKIVALSVVCFNLSQTINMSIVVIALGVSGFVTLNTFYPWLHRQ